MCNLIIFPVYKSELCTKGETLVTLNLVKNKADSSKNIAFILERIHQLLTIGSNLKTAAGVNRTILQSSQNCFCFSKNHRADIWDKIIPAAILLPDQSLQIKPNPMPSFPGFRAASQWTQVGVAIKHPINQSSPIHNRQFIPQPVPILPNSPKDFDHLFRLLFTQLVSYSTRRSNIEHPLLSRI
uniref:Uncharacterized protein n=1 Tax=Cannabis sativa TaxID=3483 RepID=A0A803PC78_CANSA